MKVLLLNRSYYPNVGGIENSLYFLSQELKQSGSEVTILTQEILQQYEQREEYASVVKYPRYTFSKLLLPFIPYLTEKKVAKWIKQHNAGLEADVVICRDPMLGLAYSRVFSNANMVYIPAVIIKFYNKGIRKTRSVKAFIKEALRYIQLKIEGYQQKKIMHLASRVIVFSKNVKDQIARGKICCTDKVSVCYPGVSKKISCQIQKFTSENSPRFLFVGRLVDEKNLEMLIKAFEKLPCENKKLVIVGDGNQRNSLERIVDAFNLSGSVVFTGETPQPEIYYSQADFFVLPSKYESFGQVIVEALTAGLPVIGFKTIQGRTLTAIDELIQEGTTGFTCSEFSEDAFCECMNKAVKVFNEKEQYIRMKEICCSFAKENFSWKKIADECIS